MKEEKKTAKPEKKGKGPEKKGKGLKIALVVIVLLVIGIAAFFVLGPLLKKTSNAILIVNQGEVQVDSGKGWQGADSGMAVYQGTKIKTLEGARASLVLFGSSVVRLGEATELSLDSIVEKEGSVSVNIKQAAGKTWSQVLQLSGIKEFEIQTPTTVATVRGTNFGVLLAGGNETSVIVDKGTVNVDSFELMEGQRRIIASLLLNAGEGVKVNPSALAELTAKQLSELGTEVGAWAQENKALDEQFIRDKIQTIKGNIAAYIGIAKTRGITDEQIDDALISYLKGEIDVKAMAEAKGLSGEESEATLRKFLNGELDPVTVAQKYDELSKVLSKE
jgi:hypothetical protein